MNKVKKQAAFKNKKGKKKTLTSSLPVLAEEARQHVCSLQLLCELDGHGHFIELRRLNSNYALRAFLVVNRHEQRAMNVTHTV